MVQALRTYRTRIGSQQPEIPVVPLSDELAIALFITVDHGVRFMARAGQDLAEVLLPYRVEVVVSVATMGIPLAIEVTRALGLDDYLILQKTPKIHLSDAIDEPVKSITTGTVQRLLFDRARTAVVTGKRVALIDDVVSTGASVRAALALVRRVGGEPVAIGTLLTEGRSWERALGEDAALVRSLGSIPLFRRSSDGALVEDWQG
ncbi:MAG: phosphoribosyltransferase [Acidimicrobiaceae bacterium]|nr:phosphoribosyltransferase [Acidimicrobiaceae bacterium]